MVSNDNTRPTAVCVLPFGAGGAGVTDVVEVVGETVVVWALVVVLVAFASVGAVDDGAELTAVGALDPSVVVGLLGTELGVCTVTGEDGVVGTDVLEVWVVCVGVVTTAAVWLTTLVGFAGLIGLIGDVGFVGLLRDFTHVSVTVVHGGITGCP